MNTIDPNRVYSFTQAALLIPSCRVGARNGTISPSTLHRWRAAGHFQAIVRGHTARRQWFVIGSELITLIGVVCGVPAQAARLPAGDEQPTHTTPLIQQLKASIADVRAKKRRLRGHAWAARKLKEDFGITVQPNGKGGAA